MYNQKQSDAYCYHYFQRDCLSKRITLTVFYICLPVSVGQSQPINEQDTVYTVALGHVVDLPCNHDLDEPVQYEWRREYTLLPPDIRTTEVCTNT